MVAVASGGPWHGHLVRNFHGQDIRVAEAIKPANPFAIPEPITEPEWSMRTGVYRWVNHPVTGECILRWMGWQ